MKMNDIPIFSIITVCYNAIDSIEQTILSVLNQTNVHIEYLVIDGGSTDGTIDIIKKYADKISYWVSEPDKGIYDAMNKGIKKATGDYINFMNSGDCFVDQNVLDNVSKYILRAPTVDIIYGNTYKFNAKKRWEDFSQKPSALKYHGVCCHQSAFIKTRYHQANLFDIRFKYMADFNFFHKAYMKGARFLKIDTFVAVYNAEFGASLSHIEDNYREIDEIISDTDTTSRYYFRKIRQLLGRCKRHFKGMISA